MNISLPTVRHDQRGFKLFAETFEKTDDCFFDDVEIDMSKTVWFDADMCAALGALLYSLGTRLNSIKLTKMSPEIRKVLSKNGFLKHYGHEKTPDTYGTTVSYKRFDVEDDRSFSGYIEREFVQRSEIPEMSAGLSKKFRESIFEIFSNAVSHSHTELGVFSCGQFFPARGELDFTIVDLGVGIRKNVAEHIEEADLPAEEAIDWATMANNTTRKGRVPGGLGLKLLCEFIDLNGGSIQISSDTGYWRRSQKRTLKKRLTHRFPGTAVCLEINTADTHSYSLKSELTEADIF